MKKTYPYNLLQHIGHEVKIVPGNSKFNYLSGFLRRRNKDFYLEYFQGERRRSYTIRKGDGIHTGDMEQFIGWVE